MTLQIGEIEYPVDGFSINANKKNENGEIVHQQRLYINFKNSEDIDALELSTQILNNYNGIFKIITSQKEYNFSNYNFEGVNIDVKENEFQANIMFTTNTN